MHCMLKIYALQITTNYDIPSYEHILLVLLKIRKSILLFLIQSPLIELGDSSD